MRRIFRSFFRKGENNIIKVFSLSLGLAIGLVLMAKVYFDISYDNFYPEIEKIYSIQSLYQNMNEYSEPDLYNRVSGGTVVNLLEVMPEAECATRFTYAFYDNNILTEEKNKINVKSILADSLFFDVFGIDVWGGNPKEILSRPGFAIISRSIAEKIGGDVIGKNINFEISPDKYYEIGAVFEDLPANSSYVYDILISMPSISNIMWDGSINVLGNDRYFGFVKLKNNTDENAFPDAIERMRQKYLPLDEIEAAGLNLNYIAFPLNDVYMKNNDTKKMIIIISLLAFILILTAILNYVLIVISSIVNKTKEIAVQKFFGASKKDIYISAIKEAVVHVGIAVLFATAFILTFRSYIESVLKVSVSDLFLSKGGLWLTLLCLSIFIITGLLLGSVYTRTPILNSINNSRHNRRIWKLSLLAFQFVSASFILSLLIIVSRQYIYITNVSPGYEYENVVYIPALGIEVSKKENIINALSQIEGVEKISSAYELPFDYPSGNQVSLPGDERELFNAADHYSVGDNFHDLFNIKIIEGKPFTPVTGNSTEVMVDREFVEKMRLLAGWEGSPIGKSFSNSSHDNKNNGEFHTICGVYENYDMGIPGARDTRPSTMYYSSEPMKNIIVLLNDINPEILGKINETLKTIIPDRDLNVYVYKDQFIWKFRDISDFRDLIMTGCIITLIITIIGLTGYAVDEINRRRKEIAIRKVLGGNHSDIQKTILSDIIKIIIPALLIGNILSMLFANQWLQSFDQKQNLSAWIFIASSLAIIVIIYSLVKYKINMEMRSGIIDKLKTE